VKHALPTLILATVLLAMPLFAACNNEGEGKTDSATEETVEEETIYACPMHPEETATEPGAKCGVCGMDLEPVEGTTGGGTDEGA